MPLTAILAIAAVSCALCALFVVRVLWPRIDRYLDRRAANYAAERFRVVVAENVAPKLPEALGDTELEDAMVEAAKDPDLEWEPHPLDLSR